MLTWTASTPVNYTVTIAGSLATVAVINPEFNGTEDITFTATDVEGGFGSDTASFEVTAVADAPVVADIPDQSVAEGVAFEEINLSLYVTDPDTDPGDLTWTASTPVNYTVTIAGSLATVAVINPEFNGTEDITFTATDVEGGFGSDTASFEVTAVADAPVVADIPDQSVAEGVAFEEINLSLYVTDPDTDPGDADICGRRALP